MAKAAHAHRAHDISANETELADMARGSGPVDLDFADANAMRTAATYATEGNGSGLFIGLAGTPPSDFGGIEPDAVGQHIDVPEGADVAGEAVAEPDYVVGFRNAADNAKGDFEQLRARQHAEINALIERLQAMAARVDKAHEVMCSAIDATQSRGVAIAAAVAEIQRRADEMEQVTNG